MKGLNVLKMCVCVCMFCSFMLVWALVLWTDLGKGLNMGGVLKCVWVSTG